MKNFSGHFCRVYGNEHTALQLSEKAEKLYSGTDPMVIYEREVEIEDSDCSIIDTEMRYAIDGLFSTVDWAGRVEWLTADEINEHLEDIADELAEQDEI